MSDSFNGYWVFSNESTHSHSRSIYIKSIFFANGLKIERERIEYYYRNRTALCIEITFYASQNECSNNNTDSVVFSFCCAAWACMQYSMCSHHRVILEACEQYTRRNNNNNNNKKHYTQCPPVNFVIFWFFFLPSIGRSFFFFFSSQLLVHHLVLF